MGCKDEKAYIYIYKYICMHYIYVYACMYTWIEEKKGKAGWDR